MIENSPTSFEFASSYGKCFLRFTSIRIDINFKSIFLSSSREINNEARKVSVCWANMFSVCRHFNQPELNNWTDTQNFARKWAACSSSQLKESASQKSNLERQSKGH